MEEQLEQKYGELMQLKQDTGDWYVKNKYQAKMDAILVLLEPMPFNLKNPITDE